MADRVDQIIRLVAEDRASKELAKVSRSADKTGKSFKSFARTAGGALAGIGITAFAAQSIKAYAEAEQSQARLELAYKKFPAVADVSIDSLRDLNSELQSKTKFDDDATASMQAQLAVFGLTGSQIRDLTPLVQDLASFTGKDMPTAADALGKAMMGNARALKTLGVDFKSTGDRGKDFAAITDVLREKVGGFAEEEGKTTAGQLAILSNSFGDLQEEVGEALVPALQGLVEVVKPVLEVFKGLPQPLKGAAVGIAAVSAAALVAGPRIGDMVTQVQDLAPAGSKARGSMVQLGKAAIGIAVLAAATEGMTRAVDDLNSRLGKGTREGSEWLARLTGPEQQGALADITQDMMLAGSGAMQMGALFSKGIGARSDIESAKNNVAAVDQALADLVASGQGEKAAGIVARFGEAVGDAKTTLPAYTAAMDAASEATGDFPPALSDVAAEAATATDEVVSFRDAIKKLLFPQLDVIDATDDMRAGFFSLAKAVKDNTPTLKANTEAGLKNREALRGQIEKIVAYGQALTDAGTPQDVARGKVYAQIEALRAQAVKWGLNADEVDAYLKRLGFVPGKVSTTVSAPGLEAAKNSAGTLKSRLDYINGKTFRGTVQIDTYLRDGTSGTGSATGSSGGRRTDPTRAIGGPVLRGTPYIVGERRPEVFIPSQSGRIAQVGAGDTVVNVYMNDEHIVTALQKARTRRGGRGLGLG